MPKYVVEIYKTETWRFNGEIELEDSDADDGYAIKAAVDAQVDWEWHDSDFDVERVVSADDVTE